MLSSVTVTVVFAIMAFIAVQGNEMGSFPSECRNSVTELDAALNHFDKCASEHFQPFGVCMQCSSRYDKVQQLFYRMIKLRTTVGEKCRTLINGTEITRLISRFGHVEKTWNDRGACDDCFATNSFNISATVRIFSDLRDRLWSCENGMKDKDPMCFHCASKFYKLWEHFDRASLVEKAESHRMCLDVVDSMKRIQAAWSDRCDDPVSRTDYLIAFLIVMSSVLAIALVFIPRMFKNPKNTRPSGDQEIVYEHI